MNELVDIEQFDAAVEDGIRKLRALHMEELRRVRTACAQLRKALSSGTVQEIETAAGELTDIDYDISTNECFSDVGDLLKAAGVYDDEAYVARAWSNQELLEGKDDAKNE